MSNSVSNTRVNNAFAPAADNAKAFDAQLKNNTAENATMDSQNLSIGGGVKNVKSAFKSAGSTIKNTFSSSKAASTHSERTVANTTAPTTPSVIGSRTSLNNEQSLAGNEQSNLSLGNDRPTATEAPASVSAHASERNVSSHEPVNSIYRAAQNDDNLFLRVDAKIQNAFSHVFPGRNGENYNERKDASNIAQREKSRENEKQRYIKDAQKTINKGNGYYWDGQNSVRMGGLLPSGERASYKAQIDPDSTGQTWISTRFDGRNARGPIPQNQQPTDRRSALSKAATNARNYLGSSDFNASAAKATTRAVEGLAATVVSPVVVGAGIGAGAGAAVGFAAMKAAPHVRNGAVATAKGIQKGAESTGSTVKTAARVTGKAAADAGNSVAKAGRDTIIGVQNEYSRQHEAITNNHRFTTDDYQKKDVRLTDIQNAKRNQELTKFYQAKIDRQVWVLNFTTNQNEKVSVLPDGSRYRSPNLKIEFAADNQSWTVRDSIGEEVARDVLETAPPLMSSRFSDAANATKAWLGSQEQRELKTKAAHTALTALSPITVPASFAAQGAKATGRGTSKAYESTKTTLDPALKATGNAARSAGRSVASGASTARTSTFEAFKTAGKATRNTFDNLARHLPSRTKGAETDAASIASSRADNSSLSQSNSELDRASITSSGGDNQFYTIDIRDIPAENRLLPRTNGSMFFEHISDEAPVHSKQSTDAPKSGSTNETSSRPDEAVETASNKNFDFDNFNDDESIIDANFTKAGTLPQATPELRRVASASGNLSALNKTGEQNIASSSSSAPVNQPATRSSSTSPAAATLPEEGQLGDKRGSLAEDNSGYTSDPVSREGSTNPIAAALDHQTEETSEAPVQKSSKKGKEPVRFVASESDNADNRSHENGLNYVGTRLSAIAKEASPDISSATRQTRSSLNARDEQTPAATVSNTKAAKKSRNPLKRATNGIQKIFGAAQSHSPAPATASSSSAPRTNAHPETIPTNWVKLSDEGLNDLSLEGYLLNEHRNVSGASKFISMSPAEQLVYKDKLMAEFKDTHTIKTDSYGFILDEELKPNQEKPKGFDFAVNNYNVFNEIWLQPRDKNNPSEYAAIYEYPKQ